MKITVTNSVFNHAFKDLRPDNFTLDGLDALFSYFEDLEQECGQDNELDVIAICCDFSEYENFGTFIDDYDTIEDFDALEEKTQVIYLDGHQNLEGRFIIKNF